jgi:hypothetical protein
MDARQVDTQVQLAVSRFHQQLWECWGFFGLATGAAVDATCRDID